MTYNVYVALAVGLDVDKKSKMSFPVIGAISVGNTYLRLKPGVG